MKLYLAIIAALSLCFLGACQTFPQANTPTSLAPAPEAPQETPSIEAQEPAPAAIPLELPQSSKSHKLPPAAQAMVQLSREDLSKRLDIDIDQIKLKTVLATTWPDASLGCPQPDTVYAQVETNGFIVLLSIQPDTFLYHTDDASTVIFCPKPAVMPDFPLTPSDIQDGKPWVPVN